MEELAGVSLAQAIPGYTPSQWASAFLVAIGAPPNATNIDTMTRWANAESGGYNPNSGGGKFNPLNVVVQDNDNHTGQGGSQGDIADFGTLADGVRAAARLFQGNQNAAGIIQGLRSSNQPATFAAIQRFYGTWGGSINFGGAPADTSVPAGSSGSSSSSSATLTSASTASDSDCFFKLPGASLGPVSLGGNCLINRAQGRGILGVATIVLGVAVMGAGVAFMFSASKAATNLIPGAALARSVLTR